MWLPIVPWIFNKPISRPQHAEHQTWHSKSEPKAGTGDKPKRGYPSHSAMAGAGNAYSGVQMMTQHEINRAVRHAQIGKITLKATTGG